MGYMIWLLAWSNSPTLRGGGGYMGYMIWLSARSNSRTLRRGPKSVTS